MASATKRTIQMELAPKWSHEMESATKWTIQIELTAKWTHEMESATKWTVQMELTPSGPLKWNLLQSVSFKCN